MRTDILLPPKMTLEKREALTYPRWGRGAILSHLIYYG